MIHQTGDLKDVEQEANLQIVTSSITNIKRIKNRTKLNKLHNVYKRINLI